jgi:hypothetical protein
MRYRKGLPWDGEGLRWIRPLFDLTGKQSSAVEREDNPDATNPRPAAAAATARSSSDQGLRRLRLVR